MNLPRTGGPARTAGPRFFSRPRPARVGLTAAAASAALAFALLSLAAPRAARAAEWIPPRPVSAWFPSATIAPGSSATLELVLRSEGVAASVEWSALSSGGFPATVNPSSGAVVLSAGAVVRIPLTVGVPVASLGLGSVSISVIYANGDNLAAKSTASIIAATGGRPEIWPASPTWSGTAGSSGTAAFTVRGGGSSETVVVTAGKTNPDANNVGLLYPGGSAPATLLVPGSGTVPLNVSGTLAGNAWAGNSNSFQVSLTSNAGISTATAFAIVETAIPDSLPTALRPIGVVPLDQGATGRDGPATLPTRGAWFVAKGLGNVEVCRASATDSIGLTDADADGGDDRLVGTIRIPSFAASLAVVPGFVAAGGETLDLGLLAAGRAGLMILDLRVIEDPIFGSWEDFFDTDQNGVDDRILRTIPLPGFATDVAWTMAPSGRLVAFVADADTGSVPVGAAFDPLATVAGTGAGVVAIDVTAAVDSLSGLPVMAGSWATPGNALDVEVRGGGDSAVIAVADGSAGLAVADVSLSSGAPTTVEFTPRTATPLSAAWGAPYARDLAWVSNSRDSAYVAVAAAAAGLQIARVPTAGSAEIVVAQQTSGVACGVASAWTGILGVAQGSAGVALFQTPGRASLDLVTAAADPPLTAPVTLARGASWPGGGAPLEQAHFQNPAGGATAVAFEPTLGPLPDLFVSDDSRMLVLRPSGTLVTAVDWEPVGAPSALGRVRLDFYPNPMSGTAILRARALTRGDGGAPLLRSGGRVDILDLQGRVVRTLRGLPAGADAGITEFRLEWDGRDRSGRRVPSGRYWARPRVGDAYVGDAVPFVVLK